MSIKTKKVVETTVETLSLDDILVIKTYYGPREIAVLKSDYSTAKLRHIVILHSTRDSLMRD